MIKMKMKSNYEIQKSLRRTWGEVKPATKVHNSKKTYSRKDQSWKKDLDN